MSNSLPRGENTRSNITVIPHPEKSFVVTGTKKTLSLPQGQQDNSNALPPGQSDRSKSRPMPHQFDRDKVHVFYFLNITIILSNMVKKCMAQPVLLCDLQNTSQATTTRYRKPERESRFQKSHFGQRPVVNSESRRSWEKNM